MSSTPKLGTTLDTTWRVAAGDPLAIADRAALADRIKPTGPIFYTQPSGADLFPGVESIKAFFKKLRRA